MNAITNNTVSIVLNNVGLKAVKSGHPWLYDQSIIKKNKEAKSGDIAVLYDEKRKFAGVGLYDANSPIVVRVLHRGQPIQLSKEWLADKFYNAIQKRQRLAADDTTTGYRLINGENDSIPGIVLDKYDTTLVLKIDSTCWLPHLQTLTDIIAESQPLDRLVLRMSRSVIKFSDKEDGEIIYGKIITEPIIFSENGILFYADPVKGQKTGFFLDQRDNRAETGRISKGEDVLNVFSYTGGFSLYAAKNGANSVTSLDLSKPALDASIENFNLNEFTCPHKTICGDAFEEMEKLVAAKVKFGVVVVDPPSFARKLSDTPSALKAYHKLIKLASKLVDRGGILVSASCSARVTKEEFFEIVKHAVKASGRKSTELKRTEHALDHRVGFPQGAYLKCVFTRID
ncbi:MAG: hypothetical protein C0603_00265 [Denitrovibrio sp.]|nr:MAG: hypothetical protein C0603_00265 [Denitrovibrio sp.]